MRRWRKLPRRIRPDQEVELSGRDLPQHGGDDQPVKWPDDRQIGSAKLIVRQDQRGRGDALSVAGACDIDYEAEIQMLVVAPGHDFKTEGKVLTVPGWLAPGRLNDTIGLLSVCP